MENDSSIAPNERIPTASVENPEPEDEKIERLLLMKNLKMPDGLMPKIYWAQRDLTIKLRVEVVGVETIKIETGMQYLFFS